jgi:hypothetical protein
VTRRAHSPRRRDTGRRNPTEEHAGIRLPDDVWILADEVQQAGVDMDPIFTRMLDWPPTDRRGVLWDGLQWLLSDSQAASISGTRETMGWRAGDAVRRLLKRIGPRIGDVRAGDAIVRAMARVMWVEAYAMFVQLHEQVGADQAAAPVERRASRRLLDLLPAANDDEDWYDVAPPTPYNANEAAALLAERISEMNGVAWIEELLSTAERRLAFRGEPDTSEHLRAAEVFGMALANEMVVGLGAGLPAFDLHLPRIETWIEPPAQAMDLGDGFMMRDAS